LEGLNPGLGVRLPSEAEWEYACRAGTTTATYAGDGPQALDAIAWWSGNSERQTHPVKQKQPNAWGLHDMLGNVWEWCSDSMRTYSSEPAVDPIHAVHGDPRVYRGGSWYSGARYVRAACRSARHPGYRSDAMGFRLARGQD
jgi:sulfatase modifying factor 1